MSTFSESSLDWTTCLLCGRVLGHQSTILRIADTPIHGDCWGKLTAWFVPPPVERDDELQAKTS
ncbi:MAG TPA: hypothetical protein VFJ24_03105 [Gaiellales bacterium]|nr:hypothetical protein [Gaiellales bacterium]